MKTKPLYICIILSGLVSGCGSQNGAGSSGFKRSTFDPGAAKLVVLGGNPVSAAGVTFVPPTAWTDLGPSGMRTATYIFGPLYGDKDSATLTVSYFGATSGGGVTDNIERWIKQMVLPDGKDPRTAAIQQEISVAGMTAHVVELAGTYNASVGSMMSGQMVAKPDYRMTAVVLEAPEGNLFFKLTGPLKTAQKMAEGFEALLLNVKKAQGTM
jgi:hypothetical protein